MNRTEILAEKIGLAYRRIYQNENFIALHAPKFAGNEKKYVLDCVESGWVSSVGSYVKKIAEEICRYSGAKYAVPTCSGTAALHLSMLVNGIGAGDEVVCPDLTFAATAAAITYSGAAPVFLDVDARTLSLCPEKLRTFLESSTSNEAGTLFNRQTGRRIRAVMVVHNVGIAADIERIGDLCRKYGLKLIEDAAESLGTTVNGRMTGTFGDAGVYSFNGNKIVTTGGGGILVTDDEQIYRRALHLSTTAKIPHEYAYIHDEIGYNYRMPNINAALGVAQIEQIEHFIMVKTEQAAAVSRYIESPDIEFYSPQGIRWNHWFVVGRLKGVEIHALIQALAKKNVMARPLWSKVSAMKPYRSFFAANNEVSSELSESVICLPNGVA